MNEASIYAIISVFIVSLTSLAGLVMLSASETSIKKLVNFLISFSAGAMIGDVFIHLLPDLVSKQQFTFQISLYVLATILAFFVLERMLHWYHHHHFSLDPHDHHIKPLAFVNLIGSSLHNITDGLVVGGAYLLDVRLGVATTIAVVLHEIPREIGDFGIFVYSGFSKGRALFFNFLTGLIALVGVFASLWIGKSQNFLPVLIAIAIGSFIYIALADLIPETHKSEGKAYAHLATFCLGIFMMFILLAL